MVLSKYRIIGLVFLSLALIVSMIRPEEAFTFTFYGILYMSTIIVGMIFVFYDIYKQRKDKKKVKK